MHSVVAVCIMLLAAFSTPSAWSVEAERDELVQVRVLALEYPPFTTEMDPTHGSSFVHLRGYLAESNLEFEPHFMPPARLQYAMSRGEWQASFVPPVKPVEAAVKFMIEDADYKFGLFRIRSNEPFRWQSLSELRGKTVAVTRTTEIGGYNAKLTKHGLNLFFVNDITQAMRLLHQGRVDYVLTVENTGWHIADTLRLERSRLQFSESLIDRFPHMIYINSGTLQGQELLKALSARQKR